MTRILSAAIAACLVLTSQVAAQATAAAAPATTAVQVAGAVQTLDCYSTLGSVPDDPTDDTFQTDGACQQTCTAKGSKVMVTSAGTSCFCGDALPPPDKKVDSDNCNTPCGGFGQKSCGGIGYYQFYLTGLGAPKVDTDSSSSTSKTSASATSATSAANTVVVTNSPTPSSDKSGGGSNKVGIAVGVVVGLVALAAIVGVTVFMFKRRRRQQLEQEHQRSAAINGFVSGSKSETSSANDSRLDPSIYSHRRESIGSIADERDFSRRILQVRNPDRESRASHV